MIDNNKDLGFTDLTIGKLKELIKDLPDDAHVFYQRIEDFYFEKNGWKVHEYKDTDFCPLYHSSKEDSQEKCPRGYYGDLIKYNRNKECKGCKYSNKYINAYWATPDSDGNLLIEAHY